MLVGPAVGGVILASGHVGLAFVTDSATFVVSALLLLALPSLPPLLQKGALTAQGLYQDVGEGLRYVAGSPLHRFLLGFFVPLCGIYCLSGGLMMPYADEILAGQRGITGSTALSALYAVMGLGGFLGSFLIPAVMRRFGALRALVLGAAMCAIELAVFGAVPRIEVVLAVLIVTSSSLPLLLVPLFTLLQQRTAPEFTGRAISALDTVVLATVSLAFSVGGVLADQLGLEATFLVSAVGMAALTILVPRTAGFRALQEEAG